MRIATQRACERYIGKSYDRLTVIDYFPGDKTLGTRPRALCECTCGGEKIVRIDVLARFAVRSCGCLLEETRSANGRRQGPKNIKHGIARTPEHTALYHAIQRCTDPSDPNYRNYGGRGITVYQEWINSPLAFFEYLGPRPSPRHSLDRYPDNNGNYEPGNVRWATPKEQGRNRRNNHMITLDGKTQCLQAWADDLNTKSRSILKRLKIGWSLRDALLTPIGGRR